MTDTTPDYIIGTAMRLCAERGWRSLRMADIAEAAKMTEAELRSVFADKTTLLQYFYDGLEPDTMELVPEDSVRDRLFAVMMERLDLATPYREAMIKMHHEGMPKVALCRTKSWLGTLPKAVGATEGMGLKTLQTMALGAIWMMVIPVWFEDDTPDLARTMATLDQQLSNAESLWQMLQPYIAYPK